ncbi:MAG TPA: hypothetical protein VGR62_04190 [Candidatus Binatia bacterium]|nr:hypothetical protein [Candidatus Binatia bacterium]
MHRVPSLLLFAVAVVTAPHVFAAPVERDPSFGIAGKARASVGPPLSHGIALAEQTDGRLVVGGAGGTASTPGTFVLGSFAIARFLTDGTLDPTFGSGGSTLTVIPGGPSHIQALALQPDGRIVAGGFQEIRASTYAFTIARYTEAGVLDPTFGDGGVVVTPAFLGGIRDLVVQPDGRIVAAGANFPGVPFAGLVRYEADGTVDASFGVGGVATVSAYELTALVRQPDGRLVAAGFRGNALNADFLIARWEANGAPDPTFGVGGVVVTDLGATFDMFHDLLVQPDGRLVATGIVSYSPDDRIGVVRYLADGSLDPSFGNGGVARSSILGPLERVAATLQPDGRVVVAATRLHMPGTFQTWDGLLRRFLPDGTLDPSFEFEDTTEFYPIGDGMRDVALDGDGRIVTAGFAVTSRSAFYPYSPEGMVFELRRYVVASDCRNGAIDPGEDCDASDDPCCNPATCRFTDGASCDDGDACTTGDVCGAGTCAGAAAAPTLPCLRCDAATGLLTPHPRTDCRQPGAAALSIRDRPGSARDRIVWSWSKGEAVTSGELGDPFDGSTSASHELCVFGPGTTPTLLLAAAIEPEALASCAKPPCWRAGGSSLRYRNSQSNAYGVQSMVLSAGLAGKARARVVMKGAGIFAAHAAVPVPTPPPVPVPLRIQLGANDGTCWEATYSPAGVSANEPGRFNARSD